MCLQNALIASWRAAFSAVPGTTAPGVPFGVTSLAGGGAEGYPLWSPDLHTNESTWLACYGRNERTPACADIADDSMGLLRRAQTGGAGVFPAGSNVFLGQAHDLGEPCMCDRNAPAPGGCWATGQCFGSGLYSLNVTHNYQVGAPSCQSVFALTTARFDPSLPLELRNPPPSESRGRAAASAGLRRAAVGWRPRAQALRVPPQRRREPRHLLRRSAAPRRRGGRPGAAPGPRPPAGPRGAADGQLDGLGVCARAAGAQRHERGCDAAAARRRGDAGRGALRVGKHPLLPRQRPGAAGSTYFCPNGGCPIVTAGSREPAVPFWASIVGGRCTCEAPWVCDE